MKRTHFWDTVPGWVALILFVVDLFLLGIVEGLQIALVELKRQHPDSYKHTHKKAYDLGLKAARADNVERFLMGRQVCVVLLVFFAAKLTTITIDREAGEGFLFPVPVWFQTAFLETGILACVVVVILAQLLPQIVAAQYPVHFLEIILMKPAYYVCVGLEATGLTHICWVLSALWTKVMGMADDLTTVNPNEALEGIEASLATVITDDEKPINNTDKCDIKISRQSSDVSETFGKLVEHIHEAVDPATLEILRHFLNTHPEKFQQFPSVVGGRCYPSPQQMTERLRNDGRAVPAFLTDISDPEHVPPHIVACELLSKNRQLQEELDRLQRKMGLAWIIPSELYPTMQRILDITPGANKGRNLEDHH